MNRDILLWIAVGALILIAISGGVYLMARGIRNNNPGNIRHGPSAWLGKSAEQTDPDYVQFDDPVYGIRALAKLLGNYQTRYGLDSIRQIITRWAPPTENITEAYVDSVSQRVGVDPDAHIDVDDHMQQLVRAIIYHENGQQPYSDEQINRAIALV